MLSALPMDRASITVRSHIISRGELPYVGGPVYD